MTTRPILISLVLLLGPISPGMAQIRLVPPPPVFDDLSRVELAVSRVTARLIEVMRDTTVSGGYRERAIRALGELRRKEAILPLFDHLLLSSGGITEPGRLACFPAGQALLHFGSDVYPKLLDVFQEERSPEYVYVLACLLYTVDGKRIALLRIEKLQVEEGLTEIQQQNITRLVNRLKTTDFDDLRNWPRSKLSEQVKVDLKAEPAN